MIDRRSKYGSSSKAFEVWKNHLVSMGYGYKLGIDLPNEGRGFYRTPSIMTVLTERGRWATQ